MVKVLVTGSAGFIGKALCRELLVRGHKVFGLDIMETPKEQFGKYERWFQPLVADITNPKYIDPAINGNWWWDQTDFCFHLAAMANVDEVRENRDKTFKVNLYGTFNIIEACKKHNVPLIFISTACAYGKTEFHPSTEDSPTLPVDWYGVTKLAGEELVKGLLDQWVILRFGTTLGIEMRKELATYIFLKAAIDNKPYPIKGSGDQTRNWIYIDDLIDGCILAMDNFDMTNREIINLVGARSYSINELVDICHALVRGNDKICSVVRLPERPSDVFQEDISIEKAWKLMGWKPKVGLKEGLERVYNEWKATGRA